jgi:membrane associated rhomboid family serine protease
MAFFQDTTPPRQRFLNAPASVLWLIALILLAHVVRELLSEPTSTNLIFDFAFIPARPADPITYFSYLFLHGSYLHAFINSLWLLAFGPPVAWRIGTTRFLAFYFFCGAVAALAHLLSDWGSGIPVVGASGAISGMMGGTIRILYGGPPPILGGVTPPRLAPITARPILFFAAIWMSVNLVAGLTGLGLTGEGESIAWVAHLGGFLAGLLTIGLFDRRVRS